MNEKEKNGLQIAVEKGIVSYDLNASLPDIETAEEANIDLMDDYWSPCEIGESKRVFFQKIDTRRVIDQQTGEIIDLECAFFMEKNPKTGTYRTISNGSKRLVGAIEANGIKAGMPFLITYTGKKKASNGNLCDNWSMKPLILSK